jgi:hypothetical protein
MPREPQQHRDADLVRAGADLERARETFVLSMGAVECKITHALDWRGWVRRRPGIALAFAFALGLLWGQRD